MRTLKALLAAATILALPAAANAQWYVGADVGGSYNDVDASGTNVTIKDGSDWSALGLGKVGYDFGGPKAEFELGYRGNDVSAWTSMVNGVYEFMPASKWHPFVGVGIGWAWLDADKLATNTTNVTVNDDDNQFAYQGFAGVAYDVSSNVALNAQYRYLATLDPEFKASNGTKVDGDYQNHSILVGFTYKFKAAPAAAPAPAPAPVAAPAPAPAPKAAPVQKNYMVFFDFNKADITPEASSIINQAVTTAKAGGKSRVDLTGHADRSGSDKYNMALSLKRANAVKASMVKQGIPAEQISVVAKGESGPLVSTADGVREPQNRRVEIVLP